MTRPLLATDRLILRPPATADFDAFAAYVGDPDNVVHIGGAQSRPIAWRSFMAYAGAWATTGVSMFWVFERRADGSEGSFVGRVGPWRPEGWPGCEVGWGLDKRVFGRGYAGMAAAAAMDYAVDALGWTDIIHTIDPANTPSERLAERLGSRRLGLVSLPDPLNRTIPAWGQSAAEWRAHRA